MMNWNPLSHLAELNKLDEESALQPVLILKHSSACSISAMALGRLERKWLPGDHQKLKPFFLDLIRYRNISNEIASRYQLRHESPQVLIISNGKCVYSASHMEISYEEIMQLK
ncbi:MAG: bacillithiol system redox-active protein YtxJ [Bacteroidota bacterium]